MLFGRSFSAGSWFRRKSALGVAVGAALAAGLVGAPAAHGSTLTPEWQMVYRSSALPSGSDGLMGVTAINATNAWAAGDKGSGASRRPSFMHWDGHTWSAYVNSNLGKIPGLAQFEPSTVRATAANNVWIFGNTSSGGAAVVVYHGSNEWSAPELPSFFEGGLTAVISPTNVWGVTYEGCGSTGGQQCVEHWNGRHWSATTAPGDIQSVTSAGKYVYFLALTGVKNFATYSIGTPVIYEPTTGKMNTIAGPKLQVTNEADSLVVEADGHKYIEGRLTTGGQPFRIWYFNGSAWAQMKVPAYVCPPGYGGGCPLLINSSISPDGGNGFWSGSETHWTGTKWVNASFYSFDTAGDVAAIRDVAPIPGTSDFWGAGVFSNSNNTPYTLITAFPAVP